MSKKISYEKKVRTINVTEDWLILPKEVCDQLLEVLKEAFRLPYIGEIDGISLRTNKGYGKTFKVQVSEG